MKKLKELLKDNEQVWFQIEDNRREKIAFLNWAKQNNCKWRDKAIEPEIDNCGIFMGIDRNLILGYVGGHCWFEANNTPQKIKFKELIGEQI